MVVVINGELKAIPEGSTPLAAQQDYLLNLLMITGHDPDNLPLGDLLRSCHNLEGEWLVASPVYWEATHNDAMIVGLGNDLQLSDKESRAWFAETARFLQEDAELFYHDAHTWLMRKTTQPPLHSPPAAKMHNVSMMPALQAMDSGFYWQRLLTELQMFLSAHPLNQQRTDKCPINGLWISGGGHVNFNADKPVFTDDSSLLKTFPQQFHALDQNFKPHKNSIVLIRDPEHMPQFPANLTTDWFWNNTAWKIPKTPIWTRLWRYLIHADKKKNTDGTGIT